MRLHRHDELVEAMARGLDREAYGIHPDFPVSQDMLNTIHYKFRRDVSVKRAAAALDAMLEAVIAREAGYYAVMKHCRADICAVGEQENAIILRMEASDDK